MKVQSFSLLCSQVSDLLAKAIRYLSLAIIMLMSSLQQTCFNGTDISYTILVFQITEAGKLNVHFPNTSVRWQKHLYGGTESIENLKKAI
jgi:hypothetical protein